MTGGCVFRVSSGSFIAAADLTVSLVVADLSEGADVSTVWLVAAGTIDVDFPFVLGVAEKRWHRPAGASKIVTTKWNWSGVIIRKEPWASNQIYQITGVFSLSVVLFVFLGIFLESPLHSLGSYASYQPIPTLFLGDPFCRADAFLPGSWPGLRSSVPHGHAEVARFRSGLPCPKRLQIRVGSKKFCASINIENRGKESFLSHEIPACGHGGRSFPGQKILLDPRRARLTAPGKNEKEKAAVSERGGSCDLASQCLKDPFFDEVQHCYQPEQVTNPCFQILIKPPQGNTLLVFVHAGASPLQLKKQIWAEMGFPVQIQHLVSGGRSLQDCRSLESYGIGPGSTIILNFRLRGGVLPQG